MKCTATTKSGTRCKNKASGTSTVCSLHGAPGCVYVLSNPSLTCLKIGRTSQTAEHRAKQLNTTGLPTAFVVEFSMVCENAVELEKKHTLCFTINEFRTTESFLM